VQWSVLRIQNSSFSSKIACIMKLQFHYPLHKMDYSTLLGCYAAGSSNFLPTFRDNPSAPSSEFKKPKGFLNPEKGTSVRSCHCSLLITHKNVVLSYCATKPNISHTIMFPHIKIPSIFLRNSLLHTIEFFSSFCITACSMELEFRLLLLNTSLTRIFLFLVISLYSLLNPFLCPYNLSLLLIYFLLFSYFPPYFWHSLCTVTHVIKFLFFHYAALKLQTVNSS
jgi:hypothetical protein